MVRQSDLVARLGGDEFLVMIDGLAPDERAAALGADRVGAKILVALREPYVLGDRDHTMTASIGVALFDETTASAQDVMKQADLALYQAKERGRNRLHVFHASLRAAVDRRLALEKDLRDGLDRQELVLHAQPQVRDDGRIVGAELLARWPHPRRGLVPPAEFIPVAEATGLILPLSRWVLREACRQISLWAGDPALGHLQLAVNVSARQFREADFDLAVLATLEEFGVDPRRLMLELTESLLVDNVEDVIAKMSYLRDRGVGISLDDFGTGYSSLAYLKRMPLTQLKIDRSFVNDALTDENNAAIVRVIITLGNTLGFEVIAEGVETPAQRQFLIDNGCRVFQGYLLGRPMPIEDFERDARAADPANVQDRAP